MNITQTVYQDGDAGCLVFLPGRNGHSSDLKQFYSANTRSLIDLKTVTPTNTNTPTVTPTNTNTPTVTPTQTINCSFGIGVIILGPTPTPTEIFGSR